MTEQWFGRHWGAPVCDDATKVETPVGETCSHCREVILPGDDGVLILHWDGERGGRMRPRHVECQTRSVVGGLNHLRGQCLCCGGTQPPDPPDMTPREAAKAATIFWMRRGR